MIHLLKALSVLLITIFAFPGAAAPNKGGSDIRENRRVKRLERKVQNLTERVRDLEVFLGSQPERPPHQKESIIYCMIVDSGYSKTFFGKAKTQLSAEYNASKSCGNSVHNTYCTNGTLKCDSTLDSPRAKGFTCMVTDTGYGKNFKAEGKTAIHAEALAKQECQKSVHSSYCGKAKTRCEAHH